MPLSDEEKAARAARYAIIEARYTREELIEKGKWWNVPEREHEELMKSETPRHAWEEMIAPRLADQTLFRGTHGQTPTPWDGTLVEHANWGNIVTTTRIGIQWLRLTPEVMGRATAQTKTIAAIMRKLGWENKKLRVPGMPISPYVWIEICSISCSISADSDDIEQEIGPNAGTVQNGIRTDDDDIPF